MNHLLLENTERGIEIHHNGVFVAEVARESEGVEIVDTYNKAKNLIVIEMQFQKKTEWGLSSSGSNPSDEEFFPMPKETALRLSQYFTG